MRLNRTLLTGFSAALIGLSGAMGAAIAQDATAPAANAETQAPAAAAPNLDEQKLRSFAVAFLEVSELTQEYQPQIAAAGSVEDQQKLQQEAGQKMVEAVNSSDGITVEEYNMIIQAAQADPELAQRINTHITDAAAAPDGAPAPAQAPAPAE
ncbi:DUF4168 domain-containing protein [Aquamicrobium zhengzhouense]|uniref:DUF4168 domain-containing protein n=1 Tax=Aquamicrobium zhengzhouense TaxID=2781738 RepID=A0ABS0SA58_9HYPH|nr:DUF4168 domain-containing protein [Aquamicrobium zhengzhouense]MBI1619412.1 DUF4168 domain-containing protein [Aquamicrobium zhengzhouense]